MGQTWRNEGVRGFYKGLSVPLAGSMFETACLFTVNNRIKAYMQGNMPHKPLSMSDVCVAGGVTGTARYRTTLKCCAIPRESLRAGFGWIVRWM